MPKIVLSYLGEFIFGKFVGALVGSIHCRRNPDLLPPLDQRHHVSVRPVPRKNEVKTRGRGGGGQ